jgi:hypothetical protein
MFHIEVVEKIKTHFIANNWFLKIVPFMRWCGTVLWSRVGHHYNTAYTLCMLNICGHKHKHAHIHTHTLRIFNTYWFSAVAVVTRTRLSVTWYVHFLSCSNTKILVLTDLFFDNEVTKTTKCRSLKFNSEVYSVQEGTYSPLYVFITVLCTGALCLPLYVCTADPGW